MNPNQAARLRRKIRNERMMSGRAQYTVATQRTLAAFLDVRLTIVDIPRTARKSWEDIVARYKSSILGPLWMTIGTLVFVVAFSVVGAVIFGIPPELRGNYTAYLAASVLWWQFIIGNLTSSSSVFITQKAFITSVREPLLSYPMRIVMHQFYTFLHSLPIILFVSWVNGLLNWNILWIIPSIIAVMLTFQGLNTIISIAGARLRDVTQAIASSTTFLFYLTPVLWDQKLVMESDNPLYKYIVYLNPLYYMLEPVRRPMIGERPETWVLIGMGLICLVSLIMSMLLVIRWRHRIAFWV